MKLADRRAFWHPEWYAMIAPGTTPPSPPAYFGESGMTGYVDMRGNEATPVLYVVRLPAAVSADTMHTLSRLCPSLQLAHSLVDPC